MVQACVSSCGPEVHSVDGLSAASAAHLMLLNIPRPLFASRQPSASIFESHSSSSLANLVKRRTTVRLLSWSTVLRHTATPVQYRQVSAAVLSSLRFRAQGSQDTPALPAASGAVHRLCRLDGLIIRSCSAAGPYIVPGPTHNLPSALYLCIPCTCMG